MPNKEFITGHLLNWSLSDSHTRITIQIGVAYGSDIDQAIRILQQVLSDHPATLEDPQPLIVFEHFGDNALELSARCFLESVDGRLTVMTQLRSAIYRAFADADISIAFPQSDVHMDGELVVRTATE